MKDGEEVIARFQSKSGWAVDCRFVLGPNDSVFVGEKPVACLSYHGDDNRLSSDVQAKKKKVRQEFQTQIIACAAIVAHSTKLHGKGINEVLDLINAAGRGFDERWEDVASIVEFGFSISNINRNWSVFHGDLDVAIEKLIVSPRGRTPYGIVDSAPYLLNKGTIYVPLAIGSA